MLNQFAMALDNAIAILQGNLYFLLCCIGLLWGIHLLNWVLNYRLNLLGIYPRHPFGLVGVVAAPFLHGNFNHLFFNSIPLFVLAGFVMMNGLTVFAFVTGFVILLSGFATWLFGRPGFHVGASGLIMGYWGYLLILAIEQSSTLAIALAIVSVYYFGGLLAGLLPGRVRESWEAHIFGFLSGVGAIYAMPFVL